MTRSFLNLISLCLIALIIVSCTTTYAFSDKEEFTAISTNINSFLDKKNSELSQNKEGAKLQNSIASDLDGDGIKEIIFVWTLIGPTYWQNNLTVLTKPKDSYEHAYTVQLIGEARVKNTDYNIITLQQKLFADSDPRCCPSIEKDVQYLWENNEITKIRD